LLVILTKTVNAEILGKSDRPTRRRISPHSLPLLCGQIPAGLRGTLYRNGPARLERGGVRVGHWFDGDGAILAVNFTDAGATGLYRYVQTDGYKEEAAAGQLLYGNYGMTAPGPIWNQWLKQSRTQPIPQCWRWINYWHCGR